MLPIETSFSPKEENGGIIIDVSGVAEYLCKPDICILHIQIENIKPKASEARQAVMKRMLYAKQCISSFRVKSKEFSDYVSITSYNNSFLCCGSIILKLTEFKIAQEIANLLVEKLEHSVKVQFKLEKSEESMRIARQKANTEALMDAKLKAQSMIANGKVQIVSVKQLGEIEQPFRQGEVNKTIDRFDWMTEIDNASLLVICKVQVSFKS